MTSQALRATSEDVAYGAARKMKDKDLFAARRVNCHHVVTKLLAAAG
jgi:hypothetical protein